MLTIAVLCCAGGFFVLGFAVIATFEDRHLRRGVDDAAEKLVDMARQMAELPRESASDAGHGSGGTSSSATAEGSSGTSSGTTAAGQADAFKSLGSLLGGLADLADRAALRSTSVVALVVSAILFLIGATVIALDSVID